MKGVQDKERDKGHDKKQDKDMNDGSQSGNLNFFFYRNIIYCRRALNFFFRWTQKILKQHYSKTGNTSKITLQV